MVPWPLTTEYRISPPPCPRSALCLPTPSLVGPGFLSHISRSSLGPEPQRIAAESGRLRVRAAARRPTRAAPGTEWPRGPDGRTRGEDRSCTT
jgi:hypothetical protein